jgi:hypothetical protein
MGGDFLWKAGSRANPLRSLALFYDRPSHAIEEYGREKQKDVEGNVDSDYSLESS